MRLVFAALALALSVCCGAQAQAAIVHQSVVLDRENTIRAELLTQALRAWNNEPSASRDKLAIVDFAKPSSQARFYILDLRTGLMAQYLTAHGKGSDPGHDGMAEVFSNESGSLASSLGAYLTTRRYYGKHGLSLALIGLEAQNSNAAARAIVLHSAPYMAAPWREKRGLPGRSFGCFVVEPHLIADVVTQLENGVMVFAGR
jgi:hypothetical protein